jgi:predicted amidohydrolase
MKICIAQFESIKGDVQKNIKKHVRFVERTVEMKGDLLMFPELSITGYEPDLAKGLATLVDDPIFNVFHDLSDTHNITIVIGMPTIAENGINISMLIFQPNKKISHYAKQILHSDELPYFVCGNRQVYLNVKNKKIALGICYEALKREHFLNIIENEADIYIASAAKSQSGMEKAYSYFPEIANEFNTPILLSNSIGYSDNFKSVGQSTVWNGQGKRLNQLNSEDQGILMYDTELDSTKIHTLMDEEINRN